MHEKTFTSAEMLAMGAAERNPELLGAPFGATEILRLLRQRGRLIAKIALGFVALTVVVLLLLPTRYSASAVVMLDPRKNNVTDLSAVLSELPTDPASVQNQIQILTSRDLAAEVVQRLDLAQDPDFSGSIVPEWLNPVHWISGLFSTVSPTVKAEQKYAAVIDEFLKHLTAEGEGLSTAVSVTYSSRDPEKAARITNAIVDAYIASQVDAKFDAARRTTQWLVRRIRDLAGEVQVAEANVQAYKAANNLNDSGEGTQSLVDQQLAAINNQLVQAREDMAEKQANFDHISSLMRSGHAADVSQVVSSPLIVQLREQQADAIRSEAELVTRYGPQHPKRIAAESQMRDLEGKIEQEVERIAGSVANDVTVARAQVKSLENSLAEAQSEANVQNVARVKLKALEANANSTRSMYEAFVTRLRETQDQDSIEVSDARVISHATIPSNPSFPPRLLIFAASIPVGLLLGLLCALLMERSGYTFASFRAVNPADRLVVLAQARNALLPRAADLVTDQPSSPFARAIGSVAKRLSDDSRPPKVIAVTSIDPREGQTNVAVGLARALAMLRRNVIVLDANLQTANAARAMGVGQTPPGLLEVLRSQVPLSRALAKDARSRVLVLRCAQPPQNAPAVWLVPQMSRLLAHLRQTSDFVIVDATPLSAAETPSLLRFADAVILVASALPGPNDRALSAANQLAAMCPAPTAVVLTA